MTARTQTVSAAAAEGWASRSVLVEQGVVALAQQRGEQRAPGREVRVERADRHPGAAGDALQRGVRALRAKGRGGLVGRLSGDDG